MGEQVVKLTEQEVDVVLYTLKQIDVRGFESMDALVGLVMFFNGKKQEASKAVEEKDNGTES